MESFNIGIVAGVVLSLGFKYIPGLSGWYEKLESENKELIMLGILMIVVGGAYLLSCYGPLNIYACTEAGAWEAVFALVGAVVGNQGTYSMLKHQKES